jgi:hypothetical protein
MSLCPSASKNLRISPVLYRELRDQKKSAFVASDFGSHELLNIQKAIDYKKKKIIKVAIGIQETRVAHKNGRFM